MKILLVTETLTAGGAETFVIRLANALADDHQVTIAVLHGEKVNPALMERVSDRVKLERLILPMKRQWFSVDGLLRRLGIDRSTIRAKQHHWLSAIADRDPPDVVHSHLLKADLAAARLCAGHPGMRHVLTFHGDYAPFLSRQADPQLLALERRMAAVVNSVDEIAAICREHLDFIATHFPEEMEKSRLIYNGYAPWNDVRADSGRRADSIVTFGMVSRGVEKKGWAKAVAAFATLPAGAARLVLVGEGPAIDRLRRGPVPEGVEFAGFSADPVEWIDQLDVGLLPSEFPHESLPTVVMEYLFCGKAVIATDVGEIGAMIRGPDGELAGTLLDFDGNQISTEQLAAAMQAYLDDPALREAHWARAGAAFAKFDMGACAAAYARLYAEVVATRSSTNASH